VERSTTDRLQTTLSLSGIIAPLVLLIAVIVAGSLHADYSQIHQPISALGAEGAPYSAVLNYGGLIPAGALTFLFSLAIWRHVEGGRWIYASAVLIALTGVGRFLAGVFPCDPGCLTFVSVSARVHAAAGVMALTTGAVAPLLMTFGLRSRHARYWFLLSLICGIGALGSLTVALSQLWPQYLGLLQRLAVAFTYMWVLLLSIGMRSRRFPV
jgi:hypothetical membrane protein